jgi:hypothetical protein
VQDVARPNVGVEGRRGAADEDAVQAPCRTTPPSSINLLPCGAPRARPTRLAVEANASGGELAEWYGVRTLAHMLAGSLVPDGYGVLSMPGAEPLHLLLELDRATEATRVLVEKARRYAEVLPRSSLSEHRPLVLIAVPNELRARSVRDALAGLLVSPVVSVWNAHTTGSALAAVQRADRRGSPGTGA